MSEWVVRLGQLASGILAQSIRADGSRRSAFHGGAAITCQHGANTCVSKACLFGLKMKPLYWQAEWPVAALHVLTTRDLSHRQACNVKIQTYQSLATVHSAAHAGYVSPYGEVTAMQVPSNCPSADVPMQLPLFMGVHVPVVGL